MKFALCSDLHLEFAPIECDFPDADLFVLAGDIVAFGQIEKEYRTYDDSTTKFLSAAYEKYGRDNVIFIQGNHEGYGSPDFYTQASRMNKMMNVLFDGAWDGKHIQEETYKIEVRDNLKIMSGTMFTSFNNYNPSIMAEAGYRMNDYRKTMVAVNEPHSMRRLSPDDVVGENKKFIAALLEEKPDVIITHHAPIHECAYGGHSGPSLIHAYYCVLAEDYLKDPDCKTKLWISGHTHNPIDVMFNNTRVVSQPRGYDGYEDIAENFTIKVVEV
jgi:predicted phosphodiesterase